MNIDQLRQDLAVLDQAMGIQISLLNEIKRSSKSTPIQKVLAQDYDIAMLQIQNDLFCEAIQDKIEQLEEKDKPSSPRSQPTSPRSSIVPVLRKSGSFLMKSPRRYKTNK